MATDDELRKMEKYLSEIFTQAGKELTKKAEKYMADFERKDNVKQSKVESGEITDDEYKEWRKNQLLYGEHWTRLIQLVQKEMSDCNKTALDYINDKTTKIFADSYNSIATVIKESPVEGYSFELVDSNTVKNLAKEDGIILPPKKNLDVQKDKLWNAKQVNAQLLQGILQGESIPKIAGRMANVCESNKSASIRNARTMVTAAENSGRQSGMNKAEADGIIFKKMWIATSDERTRETHMVLNGQLVDNGENFVTINGDEIEFPGDWRAEPREVYNCRCTLGTIVTGFNKIKLEEVIQEQQEVQVEQQTVEEQAEEQQISIREIPQRPERPKSSDYSNDSEYEQAREKYRTERDKCKAILDSYLQEDLNRTRKYKIKEDVIEWCQTNNVRIDSNVLDIIDIRVFDDVISVHEEMFKRFPKVKEFQDKFYSYGFSYDDTESKEYLFNANRGLYFGESWKDYEWALRNSVLDRMSTGYLTNGDGTLKTVLRHEFGHNVEHLVKEQFSTYELRGDDPQVKVRTEERKKYESELFELTTKYCKTEYAFTNTAEAFAEGFAEFTSNPNTEYGKAFARFFERWYKE